MTRSLEHHRPKAGVEGKCGVPIWSGGLPDGFCDRLAWSEQDHSKEFPNRRLPYTAGLACDHHGGAGPSDVRYMRDGLTTEGRPMWMAFRPDFENLAESLAGFGATQAAALANLLSQEDRNDG